MIEYENYELIKFVLSNLFSKEQINSFTSILGIYLPSRITNRRKEYYIDYLLHMPDEITLDQITRFARKQWQKPPMERHLANLRSGILKGHSWHGAMPSTLHLSLQTLIREYLKSSDEKYNLNYLIEIGGNIMKHEYFIVAVADICENLFIEKFEDTIPSITSRGISDFIFNGIPYDLKNSGVSSDWTFKRACENPKAFIRSLIKGADVQRIRKQAKGTYKNWGNNRLYVITEYDNIWIDKPERALHYLYEELKRIKEKNIKPYEINLVDTLSILSQAIFIPKEID